jgi:multidrug efflux system membrane fusion protein
MYHDREEFQDTSDKSGRQMNEPHDEMRRQTPALRFESDRGSSRPFWLASFLLLAIVVWMGSGYVFPSDEMSQEGASAEIPAPSVLVRESRAEPVTLSFKSEGQATPDRDTLIVAEATGEIVEMPVRKGQSITRGAIIARLDDTRARSILDQAIEQRANAQREFDNASDLFESGVSTRTRVSETRATLAARNSDVIAAQQVLDDLVIKAPFSGRIEALPVSAGEYVSAGDQVARIVDNDPLTVAIQVPQQSLSRIKVGQSAEVSFITGQVREGRISFVGTAAQSQTRTFLTEIQVDNADGDIPAGVSAEISIPTGEATAHFIQPSVVSLNPDGQLGVKTVTDGQVDFRKIDIVKTEVDGIWVSGLDQEATIITVGQGFVRDGEDVRVQSEAATEDELADVDAGREVVP